MEEPGGLQSVGLQRVGHDLVTGRAKKKKKKERKKRKNGRKKEFYLILDAEDNSAL